MEGPLGAEERDGAGMMQQQQQGGGVDWSQLPPELLPLVYKALPDSADFVRFRAVCRAWRESAPVSDPPPQLPWVLERRGYALQARQETRFYSPSSGRTYSAGGRGRGGRSWIHASGAGLGYVVATVDLSTTALHNPLTGERLALPAAPYPPWDNGVVHVVLDGEAGRRRRLVVNTCLETRHFAYCRPGETKWNLVTGRQDMRHHAYRDGRFFVNTAAGDTLVVDASTRAVESVVPPPTSSTDQVATFAGAADYLVESCGKLLRAVRAPRDGHVAASAEDYYFNVYELVGAAWEKVESVGDRVLFFDERGHGVSVAANEAAGLRRDCVCFVHERRTWVEAGGHRFLCRYSMEDGAVDRVVPLPDTSGDTWVVPTLCRSE